MSERIELPVPGTDATLGVIRHGHFGRPMLVFPSEAGRAEDFANNGMLDAIRGLVDAGRVTLFCVDSIDGWTWSANDQPTEERARRHRVYHGWLEQSVLPHIAHEMGGWQTEIITCGASMGAYHAAHFTLQRADVAPLPSGCPAATTRPHGVAGATSATLPTSPTRWRMSAVPTATT